MSDGAEAMVALGAVTRPHGVRGEVRVHRYNPDSDVLLQIDRATLRRDGEERPIRIASARPHGGVLLVTFTGVVGREAAEALRGFELCVPRSVLPPPDDDEYYHVDLVGLAAVGSDGMALGTVSEVIRYPSTDCLAVVSEAGVREVPLLEPYVVDVDIAAGKVVLDHLDDFAIRKLKKR